MRPYSKSSLILTLNEWRFNLSFPWVSMQFLNSWRVSSHIVSYDTSPPAIQKQQWHSREAHIELPLFECEWAFRIQAYERKFLSPSCLVTNPIKTFYFKSAIFQFIIRWMQVKMVCSDGGLRKIDLQEQKLTVNDAIHAWAMAKKRMPKNRTMETLSPHFCAQN
jgi:hypothetical protein